MQNFGIDFDILYHNLHVTLGWKKVNGHMVFGVNMDFTRNSRWVLDGNRIAYPEGSLYDGVVPRESIRIALTYTALNGMDVAAADTRNAYLQAP